MTRYFIAYAAAAGLFLAADAVWLGAIAKDLYRDQIGHLLAPDFRVGPAVLFYLMYVAGIVYFAVTPALASGRWHDSLLPAAIFGLMAYGTYDFTNWAVMRNWPVGITFIDLAWGTVLTTAAAAAGSAVAIRFG